LELYLLDRIIESSLGFLVGCTICLLLSLQTILLTASLSLLMLFHPPTPYASTTYARKLEAKVLVFGWPMGCFPKLFFYVRNKAYAWLLFLF
jgi:hypothetical protein